MSYDGVEIDPAQAARGMTAWEQADSALSSAISARLSTIASLEDGKPWGADGAGTQFAGTYTDSSGQVADGVREGHGRLSRVGQNADTAIGKSLASDEVQAAPVRSADGEFGSSGSH